MKNILLVIILTFIFCLNCNAQNHKTVVSNFIEAYNKKDSITTFKYLHKNFVEHFELISDTAIASKSDYSNNYAWGKVMNDRMEFELLQTDDNWVETMSTYYSDRDSLLDVSPYKSIRKYIIVDGQILKIIESKFSGYNKYDNPRRDKYNKFFEWLLKKHGLTISDFEYDQKGAEKLKKILLEYSKE
ncbi:hypothetical protein M0D21_07815 [Aquimarina sp. D1M17]|uniref:hypothetical protein n=1 Tax=Aquimarina acroporae TaxID=2937283 RepID=UPI0020BD840A|nr:hypothetical protein [Aquimarina acroporae]MCK8521469.1 hypothetical protein [Aquimarina acroporae]